MGRRRCAQRARRTRTALVVEAVLVAEEDHLVLEQRALIFAAVDASAVVGEPDAIDAGADVGAQFDHMHGHMLTSVVALRQGSTQRGQKANVTAVTSNAGVFRPTPNALFTGQKP